jgi:hypothetical protein
MFEILMPAYNFLLTYANRLVEDVPDERMCEQPVAGRTMNHPAWLLGHLAWAKDRAVTMLGQPSALPAEWKDRFAMGSTPQDDRGGYPSKAELLAALESAHTRLAAAAEAASVEKLSEPAPERMRSRFPTLGNFFAGLMSSHYSNHLGQLSAWRRAMGYKSAF